MKDYIMNRESLKQHCEKMCERFKNVPTSGTYSEHRLVLDLLKQTEWIPVSERFPEFNQDVLLSLRSLDIKIGFKAETKPYFYCKGVDGCYVEPKNVLAWKPLPEPYKEKTFPPVTPQPITKQDNLWMYTIFNANEIMEKTKQWAKEAEEAGMTLTEYLESISPLNKEE